MLAIALYVFTVTLKSCLLYLLPCKSMPDKLDHVLSLFRLQCIYIYGPDEWIEWDKPEMEFEGCNGEEEHSGSEPDDEEEDASEEEQDDQAAYTWEHEMFALMA